MLGLPLAFILSQDQTLHCKKFNLLAIPFSCFTAALFQRTFSLHRVDNFCRNGRQTYYQVASQSKSFFKNFSKLYPTFLLPSLFDWGGKSNQIFFSSKFLFQNFFSRARIDFLFTLPFLSGRQKYIQLPFQSKSFFKNFYLLLLVATSTSLFYRGGKSNTSDFIFPNLFS